MNNELIQATADGIITMLVFLSGMYLGWEFKKTRIEKAAEK